MEDCHPRGAVLKLFTAENPIVGVETGAIVESPAGAESCPEIITIC
jgi:hypothetical protein